MNEKVNPGGDKLLNIVFVNLSGMPVKETQQDQAKKFFLALQSLKQIDRMEK